MKKLTPKQKRMKIQRVGYKRVATLFELQAHLCLITAHNLVDVTFQKEAERLIELLSVMPVGDTAVSNLGFFTRVHHGRKNSLYSRHVG